MSAAEEYEKGKKLIPTMQFWNTLSFFLAMLGIVMMVVEMEVSRLVYNNEPNIVNVILKCANSVTTVILLFTIKNYWTTKIKVFQVKHLVHTSATVWNIPDFKRAMILEFLVCLSHLQYLVRWTAPIVFLVLATMMVQHSYPDMEELLRQHLQMHTS